MFIINGEPLHEKTHKEEFKWMKEKFEELKSKNKQKWTYAAFQRRAKILREDGRLILQKDRRRIVSMVGSTSEAVGVYQTWAYASSMGALKPDGSNGYILRRPTMALTFDTILDIDKDIELIFFFEYLSNNSKIRKVDHAAIAKENAEKTALRSKAESLIYSDDSPMHPNVAGTDELLKNIALSWGVTNALTLDMYSIMNELWNKVQTSNNSVRITKRGFQEFINEVNRYGSGSKRAVVTLAIQKGILIYDSFLWKMYTEGGLEQFLCGVPFQDEKRKNEYVMDYILNHETIYEAIKYLLDNPEIKIARPDIEELTRYDMLKKAKTDLGWSGKNYITISRMTKDELEDLLKSKRTPEPSEESL